MQFLQINLAKMRGNRVVKVAGEPYIALPLANLYAASRDAVYANFIMNETTSYGHTFVVSERRGRDGERMPIIGNASPYAPMSKDEAEVVEDNSFESVLPKGSAADGGGDPAPQSSAPAPAAPNSAAADADDHAAQAPAPAPAAPNFDPETGEIKDPLPFDQVYG